jgi:hypothetical protein
LTVIGILPHFGADRVGLSAKEDIVVSSFSVFGVEEWSTYSSDFLFFDVVALTHDTDIGYELTTLLLVNSETGLPLAPVEIYLKTAETIDTTGDVSVTDTSHLDQVLLLMESGKKLQLSCPIVYVIDREADG